MAIDKPGASNAAIYAAEILATSDPQVAERLVNYKQELARSVAEKSERVKQQFAGKKSCCASGGWIRSRINSGSSNKRRAFSPNFPVLFWFWRARVPINLMARNSSFTFETLASKIECFSQVACRPMTLA